MQLNIPIPGSAMPGLTWPALPDTGGTMLLAILAQINESQWYPPDVLRQLQWLQLGSLIEHAAAHVPWYRDRLPTATAGTAVEDYWRQVPILERESISDTPEMFHSEVLPDGHGQISQATTSGSTGVPLVIQRSSLFNVMEAAVVMRQHRWHNRDFSGRLATIAHQHSIDEYFPDGQDQPDWGWPVNMLYHTGPSCGIPLFRPIAEQVGWLQQKNPMVLLSPPSNVEALAEFCLERQIELPGLTNVSTIMEMVTPELRDLVRQAWSADIVDVYSCREAGSIAHQCPTGTHYHICTENVFVEILDEAGNPCGPGESGRVVVTPLHNFAMPLLRYELADHAELGETCPCGRGLPVITRIMGRVRNMVKYPNGKKGWARLGRPRVKRMAPAVRQFQFVQTALDTIEVRMVVATSLTDVEQSDLTELFQSRLGYPFNIRFVFLDELPRDPGGKQEDFRCEV